MMKMKLKLKRLLLLFVVMTLVVSLFPIQTLNVSQNALAKARPAIQLGTYIQFGKYNNAPILWRVIHMNQDGNPLLFADRILTIKAFDTEGSYHLNKYGTDNGRWTWGSNYYPDSNIRQWLNSSSLNRADDTIDWIQNDPYKGRLAYDLEKGFLADGNFTSVERDLIKPYTHKIMLAMDDIKQREGGSEIHVQEYEMSKIVQNYGTTAYYKNVTDHVFLLSVKQLKEFVMDQSAVLGKQYHITHPTEEALKIFDPSAQSSIPMKYWLNSPMTEYSSYVRYVHQNGKVEHWFANSPGIGVRPALQIQLSAANFEVGGDGSMYDPFVISRRVVQPVTPDLSPPAVPTNLKVSAVTGTAITLSWSTSTDNVGVAGYEIVRNGKLVATSKFNSYRVIGLNENAVQTFTVRAIDAAGNKSAMSAPMKTQPTIKVIGKQVYVNFKLLNLGPGLAPSTVKGQVVVPHKPVLEAMGLTVKYDAKTKTVTASKKGFSIKLTEGKTVAVVSGKNKSMGTAPVVQKGTLMIPLNFVAKELGYQVVAVV